MSGRRSGVRARFRWDVEGLRGLAVLLVVLFHARVAGFHGGYIGVDVFFVISGYLITRLLVAELHSTGRISLRAFYARRARRILPMATLVIAATVVVSSLLVAPLVVPQIAHDGLACALFFSNVRFASQTTNYFAPHLGPSPLLHFWSLSLEEQYYLVWPSLLLLVAGRSVRPRRLLIALGMLFASSLTVSILLTRYSKPWAFYSIPSRAWEFAVGGMLAVVGTAWLPSVLRSALAFGGLGLIGAAATMYSANTAFPGWVALMPVCGAAAVIAGGTGAGSLLTAGPLPWLGRRSYGLYLVHFPLLVLTPVAVGHPLNLGERSLVCVAAVMVSAVTYRWIENPALSSDWLIRRPRRGLAVGGTLVVATLLVIGTVLVSAPPLQGRGAAATAVRPSSVPEVQRELAIGLATRAVPRNLAPPLPDVPNDMPRYITDGCNDDYPNSNLPAPRCVYGDRRARSYVVLLGDSHAGQWFPALDLIARRHHWALIPLTKFSCPAPSVTFFVPMLGRNYDECDAFRQRAIARIRQLKPELVVLSSSKGYGTVARPTEWQRGYQATLTAIRPAAKEIIVLGDGPYWTTDPPTCVSSNLGDVRSCVRPVSEAIDGPHSLAEQKAARAAGARFVDPVPWLCVPAGCPMVVENLLVYRDTNHVTTVFSRWLANVLERAIQTSHG